MSFEGLSFEFPNLPAWVTIVSVVCLLLIAALLSAVETSITSASRPRLIEMERRGSRRAGLVNRLREQQDKFISAVLLGNNLVNILGSALTTSALIALFGDAGVIYATIIMTVLVVVFGEVMPKLWAFAHADRVALILAPFARGMIAVLSPLAAATGGAARGMLKLLGVRVRAGEAAEAAAEELRGAIELHGATHRDATVRKERQMLRSVLDLADVAVSDIMVHRRLVVAIDADQKPETILEQALSRPAHAHPAVARHVGQRRGRAARQGAAVGAARQRRRSFDDRHRADRHAPVVHPGFDEPARPARGVPPAARAFRARRRRIRRPDGRRHARGHPRGDRRRHRREARVPRAWRAPAIRRQFRRRRQRDDPRSQPPVRLATPRRGCRHDRGTRPLRGPAASRKSARRSSFTASGSRYCGAKETRSPRCASASLRMRQRKSTPLPPMRRVRRPQPPPDAALANRA